LKPDFVFGFGFGFALPLLLGFGFTVSPATVKRVRACAALHMQAATSTGHKAILAAKLLERSGASL
jgi:hypothetical protein